VSKNALRLWGEVHLDANEFDAALDIAPAGATVRYVLPQCYSGGFTRSILSNPARPTISGFKPNRCGFFSVDERNLAEGCTAGIDAGDYRDYATYFVAALAGQTRLAQPLDIDPDANNDGQVSLAEAHIFAFTEGFSTDIPRSTSDYFLELWEPWYVRWHSFVPISRDNHYWLMAQRLATRLDIKSIDAHAMAMDALAQRQALAEEIETQQEKHDRNHAQAEQLQKDLRRRFLRT